MADTFTDKLRLIEPEIGANNNTWGDDLNVNFQLIDDRLNGLVTINTTGGDTSLTQNDGATDQSRYSTLVISGTLTSNANIILPDTGARTYVIINTTDGAFTVTVKTSGGNGVEIPQNSQPYLVFRRTTAQGVQRVRIPQGALTNSAQDWTAGQAVTSVTLTDAATIATNATLSNNFRVTLGGNRTLGNPTNAKDAQILEYLVIQDATGSRTLSYGNKFRAPGGAFPTLTTTAGHADLLTFKYDSASDRFLFLSAVKDYDLT